MSLWEISAIAKAIARFHGGEDKPQPPSPEEHDAHVEKYA